MFIQCSVQAGALLCIVAYESKMSKEQIGSMEGAPHMGLATLHVAEGHRRKGVAMALMRAYEKMTLEHTDCKYVAFQCARKNNAARALYKKLGYVELEDEDNDDPDYDCITIRKDLVLSNVSNKRKTMSSTSLVPSVKLLVKKLSPAAVIPTRGSAGAAGYDLASAKDVVVPARGKQIVPTALSIALPTGTYGRVAPRSGLAWKNFIDVGAGVIDQDYRGEVGVILFNHSDQDFVVKPGDRVAQLILEKIEIADVQEVSDLDDTKRGSGGFGSTGTASLQGAGAGATKDEAATGQEPQLKKRRVDQVEHKSLPSKS